ncbi:MAG: DUF502 domain-containing protein [Gammaproteobacteria bacterium]|nr:DUF502 domain-containing protein [Gammaproteobacteria bacterium]
MTKKKHSLFNVRRYLVSGVITVVPLWVTWWVFDLVVGQLSRLGRPWASVLSGNIRENSPALAQWILEPWFQNVLAVLITLLGLYILGWAVTRVLGRRILNSFESLLSRLPFVQTVYGAIRKLVLALQQQPADVQRVVLVEFPSRDMKAVGLVTRTLVDTGNGRKLAAVYMPTTPNPTSGYLEIVPVERLISTDWTIDEAMNFIVSGGAVSPEGIRYFTDHERPTRS